MRQNIDGSLILTEYHRDGFRGNLSQRSLLDVVKKEHLVEDSEFLETLLVAVPTSVLRVRSADT